MKVKETPIETFQIEVICNLCYEGTYINQEKINNRPPFFVHKCNKCGHEKSFNNHYPTIGYRPNGPSVIKEFTEEEAEKL